MAIPKVLNAQRDFSGGELDETIKRADEMPLMKTGARQMLNWRIVSSKSIQNRPGRSALFTLSGALNGRVEEFTMAGQLFYLGFGPGVIGIMNNVGALIFNSGTFRLTPAGAPVAIPWTSLSMGGIVWAQIKNTIYIAYPDGAPNNVPQVLSFDGVSTWTLQPYAETVAYTGQKRTLFYRLSPANTTLLPSATIGNINITFSTNILSAGMVGTRLEYCGQQLTITGVSTPTTGTATVNEPLPPGQVLLYTTGTGRINVGDVLIGSITGAHGIVTATATGAQVLQFRNNIGYSSPSNNTGDTLTGGTSATTAIVTGSNYYFDGTTFYIWLNVQITAGPGFTAGEIVTGPAGAVTVNAVSATTSGQATVQIIPAGTTDNIVQFAGTETAVGPSGSIVLTGNSITTPQAVADWDDEVMNRFRGYPASVFYDQSRLGFTNFPALPQGIAWGAIGLPYDLFVGALPGNAIFELAPDNSQVFYVIPGMESSEFVFTDRAIYYIPITPTVPLAPGSVAFNKLSDYGCMPNVQPRRSEQSIIYIKAGGVQVGAVQAPGAYYRPYVVDKISELHTHLFTASPPVAIAIPSGPNQFSEQYIYINRADGAVVVGHFAMRQGLIEPGPEGKPAIGWVPWTSSGFATWIAARQSDVIFTSNYFPVGAPAVAIVERLDNNQYLDGALFVNSLPPGFVPPGGKGPCFLFPGPNTTVFLIDQGTRFMGTYQIDANGFIIPQNIGGENLMSTQLVAGQSWQAMLEIWMPGATPGQSVRQRTLRRRVSHMTADVSNSTGFTFVRGYLGPPALAPPGNIANSRRIPYYYVGEDPTQPAPLREEMQRWRPIGRAFDPRMGIFKDTPGPLLVHEIGIEVTV